MRISDSAKINAVFCIFLAAACGLAAEYKVCSVKFRRLPQQENWDSNFTALLAASDGKVYIGLNYHGHGANVAVYDPPTDCMALLGDLRELTGEQNLKESLNQRFIPRFVRERTAKYISPRIFRPGTGLPRPARQKEFRADTGLFTTPKTGPLRI